MSAILDLSFNMSYIEYALEKEKEDTVFDLWKSIYPQMMIGNMDFISFEDFKNKIYSKKYKYSVKTNDEIEKEFEILIANNKGR